MKLPSPPTGHPTGSITSAAAIVVSVIVCIVGLLLLVPNRSELFERFITDGDARSAAALVTMENSTDQNAVITALTRETLQLCHDHQWNTKSLAILNKFLRSTDDLAPITAEILRQSDTIPAGPRTTLLGTLVDRALSSGDLGLAEKMQLQLLDAAKPLTPDLVRQAVTTFRYNNNPALALSTIGQLEAQGDAIPVDLYETRIILARETSQPAVAFALLKEKIKATKDPASLRQLIPTAIRTGIEAGQQGTLIPLYLAYLDVAEKDANDPLVTHYAIRLAQTYEWTGHPDQAFDVYSALASSGHREALERCRILSPGLYRTADLLDVLVAGRAHFEKDDELLLLTSRLLAEAGRHEEAIVSYSKVLDRLPDHADSHYRLGLVYDATSEFEMACNQFQQALVLDPENPDYLLWAARVAIISKQYELALSLQQSLCTITGEIEHAENYHILAANHGDTAVLKNSLQILIDLESPDSAGFYNHLAEVHHAEGRLDHSAGVLAKGVAAFPKNTSLALGLASAQIARNHPELALKTLATLRLTDHPSVAPTVISSLLSIRGSTKTIRTYLHRFGPELDHHAPAELLIELAELHQRVGNLTRSRALYRRTVQECKDPGILARAWFQLGESTTARSYQLAHIRRTTNPASTDYQFLGDIYARLDDDSHARTSYLEALTLLKTETARR